MHRLTLALPCLVVALSVDVHSEVWTFPAAKLDAISIKVESGDADVRGSSAEDITVSVSKLDSAKCELTMESSGNTLKLAVKTKNRARWTKGCQAGFIVTAPVRISVGLSVGSGNVNVKERKAPLHLDLGSGDAVLDNVSGELKARLGSGDIKGVVASQRVDLRAGSGNVELAWSANISEGRIDIQTGSGDVALRFPRNTELAADMSVASGSARSDFLNNQKARLFVAVRSGSGDVGISAGPAVN